MPPNLFTQIFAYLLGNYHAISILLLRNQLFVNDKEWLKRMISHHSTALTTSHKIYKKTNNSKLKDLSKNIIDTQEKEIQLMKSMV